MRVLLSIRPEFALRIFDGSKRYEYRRAIFKTHDVKTVVVYASHPIRRVIGEFDIAEILCDIPEVLWEKTSQSAGITRKKFLAYFENKEMGYAIAVKTARAYDSPLFLRDLMVTYPPQSFLYLCS